MLYLWRIGGRVVYVGMSGGWVKGSRIARYLAEGPGFSESSKMLPWLTAIDEGKEIELRVSAVGAHEYRSWCTGARLKTHLHVLRPQTYIAL